MKKQVVEGEYKYIAKCTITKRFKTKKEMDKFLYFHATEIYFIHKLVKGLWRNGRVMGWVGRRLKVYFNNRTSGR